MIRVYDSYGRELYITREQWRDSVLMGHVEKVWDDPEELASVIIQSLHDEFCEEMLKPAEHLIEIDPDPERSSVLLAAVCLRTKRLDRAERTLTAFIEQHGERGLVLTNLAKVYSERGDEARALETLWRGLQLDPNQDNGLLWYESIHRDRAGEQAGHEALRRAASIPGSWRAQLWLARAALKQGELEEAIRLYEDSLENAGEVAPTDLLMQMTGDLGNCGHLQEVLSLAASRLDVSVHGLQVGNNLIKAHVDLGQFDEAKRLLDSLYAQKRPDWKETLSFWDTEIAKQRLAARPASPESPLKMALLSIEGPVWLPDASPAVELFSTVREDVPWVCFLGATAEKATEGEAVQHQLSDTPGRLSRALPLFLAEHTEFHLQARGRTLVPWIADGPSGFVLSAVAWPDDDAAAYARQASPPADYLALVHLGTTSSTWRAYVRLIRTIDGSCLAHCEQSFTPAEPGEAMNNLANRLQALLREHAGLPPQPPSANYDVPWGAQFPYYLLRLEQLLAIRCSSLDGVDSSFLSGEREILDGNLQLCLEQPKNVTCRILLAQTCLGMKKCRPAIVSEYRDKLARLQQEHPLEEPVQSVVGRIFAEVLA